MAERDIREEYIQERMAHIEKIRKTGKPLDPSEFEDDTAVMGAQRGGTREALKRLLAKDKEKAAAKAAMPVPSTAIDNTTPQ